MRNYRFKRKAPVEEKPEVEAQRKPLPQRQEWQPRPEPEPPPPPRKESSHELPWLGSYIILLVLAPMLQPFIHFEIGGKEMIFSSYWPLLATAVPVLIAASIVRPDNLAFFAAAPLLPVAAYFSLQGSTNHLLLLLFVLLSMCGLPLYHVFNASKPGEGLDTYVRGERYEDDRPRQTGFRRAYWRRVLTFGVIFMTAVLLIPAVLGVLLPEPVPMEAETMVTEELAPLNLERVLIELSKPWPEKMEEREAVLQALLDQECAKQPAGSFYLLNDPVIKAITIDGRRAAAMARRSKEGDLELRLELICYIAKVQKLRESAKLQSAQPDEDGRLPRVTNRMRNDAKIYAKGEAKIYMGMLHAES